MEPVEVTCQAVVLVTRLLDVHHLARRSRTAAPGQQPAQAQSKSSEEPGTAANASSQAQASHQPDVWPTPEPNEWQDVELVATRACASLDWAVSLTVNQDFPTVGMKMMAWQLKELLQRLVIGHLPDLDLDMCALFRAALKPVLSALLAGHSNTQSWQLQCCQGWR
ncbi:hypothetical protein ABBQ32_004687 [Trebouxia sp. C0010 RCD-2024]